MIYIEYCETGQPVNDFMLEYEFSWVRGYVLEGKDDTLRYSTENIFSRIRLGIVRGEISHKDVTFVFEEQHLYPNEYGNILNWPPKFCSLSAELSENILTSVFKLHKANFPEKYKK